VYRCPPLVLYLLSPLSFLLHMDVLARRFSNILIPVACNKLCNKKLRVVLLMVLMSCIHPTKFKVEAS
jgi:hypothetical protein